LTASDNPYFAQAAVNRFWAHLFGSGFVNPIDDFQEGVPASHPALLQFLAQEFVASGHDHKHLLRCICNSQTYQRTSRRLPPATGEMEVVDDQGLFSHMAVKVMTPHVMYDSLVTAMGVRNLAGGLGSPLPFELYAGDRARADRLQPRDEFIRFFTTQDPSAKSTEYTQGIPQVLALMNARQFNTVTPLVEKLVKEGVKQEQAIEALFLATLSRRPAPREVELLGGYLAKRSDPRAGYTGVLWILINSNEFMMNH
jgi:hypothetical protein